LFAVQGHESFDALPIGHDQVSDDKVGWLDPEAAGALLSVSRLPDGVSGLGKRGGKNHAEGFVVVDEEDVGHK
jgi:hypothetical protein